MAVVGVAGLILVLIAPLVWDILHKENPIARQLKDQHEARASGPDIQKDGMDSDRGDINNHD